MNLQSLEDFKKEREEERKRWAAITCQGPLTLASESFIDRSTTRILLYRCQTCGAIVAESTNFTDVDAFMDNNPFAVEELIEFGGWSREHFRPGHETDRLPVPALFHQAFEEGRA